MAVKIRLQRFGRKQRAYYHIVVADSRAPRDGKFIERLGDYNPNTNPATINLDVEKAVNWLGNGAQPSDTCRAILSYKGVLYRHHLNAGIRKGALTEEQAEAKFAEWLTGKEERVAGKQDRLAQEAGQKSQSRLAAESKVSEERAKKIAAKTSPVAEEVEETPVAETPAVEETPVAEAPAEETPVAETPAEETPVAETPAEETPSVEETPAEEKETPSESPAEEQAPEEEDKKEGE